MTRLTLPFLGNRNDVERIAKYLQTKPMGAKEADLKTALGRSCVDSRKRGFYDVVGFFARQGDAYRLTSSGLDYLKSDRPSRVLWPQFVSFRPYLALLEWAYHSSAEVIDSDQARHFWVQNFADTLDLTNASRLAAAPLPMFEMSAMAGLGESVLGRRGAKSRLQIDRSAMEEFVQSVAGSTARRDPLTTPGSLSSADLTTPPEPPAAASPGPSAQTEVPGGQRQYVFSIPIAGRVAQLVWCEPAMTPKEWLKFKKVGDAMFESE